MPRASTTRPVSPLQTTGLVLLLAACLLLSLLGYRWLQAELLFWQTDQLFSEWEGRQAQENWLENPGSLALVEWEGAERRLALARALHPDQPRYHELQSRLALWRIHTPWQKELSDAARAQALAELPLQVVADMLEQSWQAARAKPSWPYGWLEVVILHNANGLYDARFRFALAQTLRNGGNVRDVQRALAAMTTQHAATLNTALADDPRSLELLRLNLQRARGTSSRAARPLPAAGR